MPLEDEEVENGVNPLTVFILGILFLPAGVTALGFYLLLRRLHLRFSSIFQIGVIFEFFLFLIWKITHAAASLTNLTRHPLTQLRDWHSFILPLILSYAALGAVVGVLITWWEIRQMRINPHRIELKGNWQYHFKFKRGLSQVLRRRRRLQALHNGHLTSNAVAPLGMNEEDEDRIVGRYYSESLVHTLLSGASGSGKTVTMQSLIRSDLENRIPTIVLDFKRSPEFASKVAAWAHEYDCNFYHFVNGAPDEYDIKYSEGPVRYDPLASGNPTAKADMVLAMREYDTASAVYKANMQQLLQVLLSMLHYARRDDPALLARTYSDASGRQVSNVERFINGEENREAITQGRRRGMKGNNVQVALQLGLLSVNLSPAIAWEAGGIYQLFSAISGDNFAGLVEAVRGTPIETEALEVGEQLRGKSSLRHALEELQGQIRTIVASEYGQWLRMNEVDRGIDLLKLTSEPGNVILFSLNSDSEPEFAKYVGSLILADITNLSARRRNKQLKNQVHVYVDEFQAVNPTAVTGLLEKSREARMGVTLAQQSFEQVVASAPQNGEAFLSSILDTCSNFIIHNGMTGDSAERLSKILGKHWVTEYRSTNKNQSFFLSANWKNKRDSVVQTSEKEVWVFPPRRFMTLMSPTRENGFKGTAVIINKSCADPAYVGREGAVARRVWLVPDLRVLDTYYDPTYRLTDEGSSVEIVHDDGTSVEFMRDMDLHLSPSPAEPLNIHESLDDNVAADDVLDQWNSSAPPPPAIVTPPKISVLKNSPLASSANIEEETGTHDGGEPEEFTLPPL